MEAARTNGQDDVINLAPNGLYLINQLFNQNLIISSVSFGAMGLPNNELSRSLTINGNNSTIRRAVNAPRFRLLFCAQNATLILNDLNLENGHGTAQGGGAVFVQFQSILRVNNCKFIGNNSGGSPRGFGGAIATGSRCNLSLRNSTFLDNQSFSQGGGVYNVLSDLLVENCLFKNNATTSPTGRASGGGLYVDGGRTNGGQGFITIRNSRFEGNRASPNSQASNEGGGLYLYGYNNNIILLENSTIINNEAKSFGGGMLIDNESSDDIQPNNVDITVRNCLIAYNRCVSSQGGGIYSGGIQVQEPASSNAITKIINCTIVHNQAGSYGGGIVNYLNGASVMNCTIAYNEAAIGGGAIQSQRIVNLNNSIMAFNRVNTTIGNSANCGSIYTGSNNIQFPDLVQNINDRYCTTGIIVANPMLGPLQDNGGPTLTMALLPGSPAINGGNAAFANPTDQRGIPRQGAPDIGAFEFVSSNVTLPNLEDIYLEAECSTVGSNWNVIESAQASGGKYAEIKSNFNSFSPSTATGANNRVRFSFTVPQNGEYAIYARVLALNSNDDSFFISLDGASPISWWENLYILGESGFRWRQVLNQNFTLTAGQHTFDVYYRENGTGLDKIFIGKSNHYPSELGVGLVCGSSPVLPTPFYLEAECGTVGSNWNVINSNEASGEEYVEIKPNFNSYNSNTATGANNRVRFSFTVPQNDEYSIYARVLALNGNDDSFFISLDGASPISWWEDVFIPGEVGFRWRRVLNQNFTLTAGQHTLDIYYRENGTGLDKLFIGKNGEFPSESGIATNCNPNTPVITPFVTFLEAECGEVGSNWNIINASEASEGKYVEIKSNFNSFSPSTATGANNRVRFSFVVPQNGEYGIYARVLAPNGNDDSFFISLDGASPISWWENVFIPGEGGFRWRQILNRNFTLTAGQHTIDVYYRENGTGLDKLFIGESGLIPSGLGDNAQNCVAQKSMLDTVTTPTFEIEEARWSLYPNPISTQNILTLSYTGDTSLQEKVSYIIQDRMGRTILKGEQIIKENQIQIDLSNQIMSTGSYILRISGSGLTPKSIQFIKY
jgi:hypothetical protein